MPHVEISLPINAPASETWEAVKRLEDYATFMENVESVTMTGTSADGVRTSDWSVLLKGSLLEWTEEDTLDEERRIMSFTQISGDLDEFAGHWKVDDAGDGTSIVSFVVDFDLGLPLLADMLNPVAAKAVRENSEHMLQAIERRLAAV